MAREESVSSPQHDAGHVRRERQTWLVLATIVVVGHWAGGALFHAAEHAWREWIWPTWWFLMPLALLGAVLWALFALRLGSRSRITRKHGVAIGYAGATTVVSFGAATSAEQTIVALANGSAIERWDFFGGALYWIVFAALIVTLFKHRYDLGAVIRFPKQKPSPPRRHLILFLSHLVGSDGKPLQDKDDKSLYTSGIPNWFVADREARKAQGHAVDIQGDLLGLLNLKKKDARLRWTWEMPLRAIQHHLPELEQVTVVCSPSSLVQTPWFLDIAEEYFPGVTFALWAESEQTRRLERIVGADARKRIDKLAGRDFEELDVLSGAIRDLLDTLTQLDVPDQDIVIDFTGGQKPTSIVAASITFNRPINAQYVRTDGQFVRPGDDIISFDLSVDAVGAGPG